VAASVRPAAAFSFRRVFSLGFGMFAMDQAFCAAAPKAVMMWLDCPQNYLAIQRT